MASYLIRVVLHGAQAEHYELLHERMGWIGAERTITADDGQTYDLPDAEYRLDSLASVSEVRNNVCIVAEGVKAYPLPAVLVVEFQRCAWQLAVLPGRS